MLVIYNYQISIAETGKTLYRRASTKKELISSLLKEGINEHHTLEINRLGIAQKIRTVKKSEGYKVLQPIYHTGGVSV